MPFPTQDYFIGGLLGELPVDIWILVTCRKGLVKAGLSTENNETLMPLGRGHTGGRGGSVGPTCWETRKG